MNDKIKSKSMLWIVLMFIPLINWIVLLVNGFKAKIKMYQIFGFITCSQLIALIISTVVTGSSPTESNMVLLDNICMWIAVIMYIVAIIVAFAKMAEYKKNTLLLSYAQCISVDYTDLNDLDKKYGLYIKQVKEAEAERVKKEKEEKEKREKERLEKERLEKARLEKEKQEKERLEKERREKEKQEKERLEKERLEKEKQEQVVNEKTAESIVDESKDDKIKNRLSRLKR